MSISRTAPSHAPLGTGAPRLAISRAAPSHAPQASEAIDAKEGHPDLLKFVYAMDDADHELFTLAEIEKMQSKNTMEVLDPGTQPTISATDRLDLSDQSTCGRSLR